MTLDGTGSTLGPGFTLLWTAPGIVFDELLDVESSEPDDGVGDGHTTNDVEGAETGTDDGPRGDPGPPRSGRRIRR